MNRKGATVVLLVCLLFVAAIPLFAQQDTQPPTLTALSFTPAQVDTTSTTATVNLNAQVTDDLSGVSFVQGVFTSPSGQHYAYAYFYLTSGTNLNGTYTGTATIPAFTEPGAWTLDWVIVQDNVGNHPTLPTCRL